MALEFHLHLKDVNDLFVFNPLTYDPFDPNALREAGLDHIVARASGSWIGVPKIRTTVHVPEGKFAPDLERQVRAAVRRYGAGELVENCRARGEFFLTNFVFLCIAVVIVLVGLWLQAHIADTPLISDPDIRSALGFGIDVLVWVALWTPVSAFVLDWYPFYRKQQAYMAVMRMDLSVQPEK
jgi:hypothetical protein